MEGLCGNQNLTLDAACRGGLEAVKADTAPLLRAAEDMDGGADLAELRGSCEAAAGAGAALGSRQAGALGAAAQELLCSPEITRCALRLLDCYCPMDMR